MTFEKSSDTNFSALAADASHCRESEAPSGLTNAWGATGNRPRRRSASRDACGRRRRGAAVVEFAIVVPLLLLMVLGIIEFGRMIMVQQILTNASREGARRAILEQSTADRVKTLVGEYLAGTTVSGATVAVSPGDLKSIGFGDPVTVTVSVPYDRVSWIPSSWFLSGATLSAQSVMHGESAE